MKCPYCHYREDKVVDSRTTQQGSAIRRRRECLGCAQRFTTYEYIEDVPFMVVKKDGGRQPFDRKKILAGIMKACEKRPISIDTMEEVVNHVERSIHKRQEREIASSKIGEILMEKLKTLDEVAYVRFASVYRQFKDVEQFMSELKGIIDKGKIKRKKKKRGQAYDRNGA